MSDPAREYDAIEQTQPYKRDPIHPDTDPLYIISKLDNIGEHRLILELQHTVSTSGTIFPQGGPPMQFKVIKHPVILRTGKLDIEVPLPDSPYEMSVDGCDR